ncbi:TOM1-like protein 2 [Canna indica]|uniref:TOM1-like protein 2 n=1 Tax=Canna indica TaxID=4628 RepID=A0AAQ3Q6Q9_9LILI|nr:TOM1-like protein 2 [Canna indica]
MVRCSLRSTEVGLGLPPPASTTSPATAPLPIHTVARARKASRRRQAKDVVKAVKKRLQHKNPKVQFLALMLLETMIKNCGDYVHFQVVEHEILQEMVKIVRKKVSLFSSSSLSIISAEFDRMIISHLSYTQRSGVQFPECPPDSTLIFTPPAHASPTTRPQAGYGMPSNSSLRLNETMASEMANLSLSDLDSMQSVMELLSEMLKAVNPIDRAVVKDEVIIDLVNQCRSNQNKLMQSINSIRDEELLGRGLELNDNLQSLLAKHDAIASGSPLPADVSEAIPTTSSLFQPLVVEVSESTSPKTIVAPQPAAPTCTFG